MMGYIVGSVAETDAFLYDLRRTVADVISDNYLELSRPYVIRLVWILQHRQLVTG